MSFRRDLAGMSSAQWAVVCVCTFIVSMGAALGLLTPSPNRLDRSGRRYSIPCLRDQTRARVNAA